MNFYPHHIGDYAKDTAHLSMVEDGAYRRLIDLYYTRERPIPADMPTAYRLARAHTKVERDAVKTVLQEFFVETEIGFTHTRCEKEIEIAKTRISAAQRNGTKGGRPRKQGLHGDMQGTEQNPLGLDSEPAGFSVGYENETQQKAHQSHTPITINHKPNSKGARPAPLSVQPPSLDDVRAAFQRNENGYLEADESAAELFDWYSAYGWTRKNGKKIYSLDDLVSEWIARGEVQQ